MAEKANNAADISSALAVLPPVNEFVDGRPFDQAAGGVFAHAGDYWALARPDTVVQTAAEELDGHVRGNRLARIPLHDNSESLQTDFGAEFEAFRLGATGHPQALPDGEMPELLTYMDEAGTPPQDDPAELLDSYVEMLAAMQDRAEIEQAWVLPTATFGQREPAAEEQNPHNYISHITGVMEQVTGFNTRKIFRGAGAQEHTRVSSTLGALEAGEAMQYLNPILMAPGLAGPFLNGGLAGNLAGLELSPAQRQHMHKVGLAEADLSGQYQSWRYLLRRLGSVAGGIWLEPAADTVEEYLARANGQLASGEINTIDRTMGMHTDRLRAVLAGNGVSTFEGCASDTYLGDPKQLHANHLLRSALFTSLEAMAVKGQHPRDKLGDTFRMPTHRDVRLQRANQASLKVSRSGTDAVVYGKPVTAWLSLLFELADQAPSVALTDDTKATIRSSFASWTETKSALRTWCADHHTDQPSTAAYYELGLNNPAVYMQAQLEALGRQHPNWSREQLIRSCELSIAQTFHRVGALAMTSR